MMHAIQPNSSFAPSISVFSIRTNLKFIMDHYQISESDPMHDRIRTQLDEFSYMNDHDRVPLTKIKQMMGVFTRNLDIQQMPLDFVNNLDLLQAPTFKYILKNSVTTLDFLRLVSRYMSISTHVFQFETKVHDESIEIKIIPHNPELTIADQFEGMTMLWCRLLKLANGPTQLKINFSHSRRLKDINSYERYFGVKPDFDAPYTSISFSSEWANKVIGVGGHSPVLTNISQLEKLRCQTLPISLEEQVVALIKEALIFDEPTRQQIASLLNVSVRTLQRHLQKEGHTFKSLLANTRIELCREYLKDRRFSCSDMAFLLGYRDPSQFFKAFKSWFGVTPSQYRAESALAFSN